MCPPSDKSNATDDRVIDAALSKQSLVSLGIIGGASAIEKVRFDGNTAEFWTKHAQYLDTELARLLPAIRPDVIVVDQAVTLPAVELSGIPCVWLWSSSPLLILDDERTPPGESGLSATGDPRLWHEFHQLVRDVKIEKWRAFNDWVVGRGCEPLPEHCFYNPSHYLHIYGYPLELDYQDIRPLGRNYVRFDNFKRTERHMTFAVPQELAAKPGALIYFSFGSLCPVDVQNMRRLVAILAKSRHRFIVSMGPKHMEYTLADNMWGAESVPQIRVLPLVDLVITHCGSHRLSATGDPKLWHEFRQLIRDVKIEQWRAFNDWVVGRGCEPLPEHCFHNPSHYLHIYGYPLELDYQDIRPLGRNYVRFDNFKRTEQNMTFVVPPELAAKPYELSNKYSIVGKIRKLVILRKILNKLRHFCQTIIGLYSSGDFGQAFSQCFIVEQSLDRRQQLLFRALDSDLWHRLRAPHIVAQSVLLMLRTHRYDETVRRIGQNGDQSAHVLHVDRTERAEREVDQLSGLCGQLWRHSECHVPFGALKMIEADVIASQRPNVLIVQLQGIAVYMKITRWVVKAEFGQWFAAPADHPIVKLPPLLALHVSNQLAKLVPQSRVSRSGKSYKFGIHLTR
ncbi:unnamed protein product, partial [Medioppia subpectinata]